MKFIELFAGIGGFRYGLEKAGEFIQPGNSLGYMGQDRDKSDNNNSNGRGRRTYTYDCVYANEWDKYAAQIYEKNFGQRPDTRDITTVGVDEIPDHDLLTGGFPCQAFSIAGKRKGFDDTRGTLFFEIARILQAKKPKYCLLENVKGLLSHDRGRTFQTILATLDELGYDLQWQVLNSKNFGVPQNRERVFIIGHIRGQRRPEVFPIRAASQEPDSRNTEIANCLQSPGHACGNYKGMTMIHNVYGGFNEGVREFTDYSPTIRTPKGGGHLPMVADYRYDEGLRIRKNNISPTVRQEFKGQDISKSALLINEINIRRLTPIECERLQGFPDNWTEGISDTQRYKCLGNAVTTNVITEIGKRLYETI